MADEKPRRKRGRPRKTDAEILASGDPTSISRRKRENAVGAMANRPTAWDRKLPPDSAVISGPRAREVLIDRTGYDPERDAKGFKFDAARGRAAVRWFHRHLTHVKGPLAGQAFRLSEIEQAILIHLFGWRDGKGLRRYRELMVYVPRKFGKTLFAAGLALYLFVEAESDDPTSPKFWTYAEGGVEAYCAAAAREQAKLLWTAARRMVLNDEMLSMRTRLYQHSIVRLDNTGQQDGSWFQAISAEANTAHGYNPSFVVVDELHAQPDGELVDVLETGTGTRLEPLLVYITTADYERESVCNEKRDYAVKVRDGHVRDATYFPVLFEADEGVDWSDPAVWARVNPHYPETPTRAYMEKQCAKAKETPRFLNTFLRLHLNMRTKADVAWLDMGLWDKCGEAFDPASLEGRPCYAALDVSSVSDLTGLVLFFPEDDNRVLPFAWAPRATALQREERHLVPSYLAWAREGAMELTPGNRIDQRVVRARLNELAQVYDIRMLAVDRWNADKIVMELKEEDGFNVVLFGQGFGSLSAPSKELERMVLAEELRHAGHPVMRWCAGNAMAAVDTRSTVESIKPVKAETKKKARNKYDNKIDLLVCLVMAIGLSMHDEELHKPDLNAYYASSGGYMGL